MEEEYWGLCDVCDVQSQVIVVDSEDVPAFCPMCGSDLEFENLADQ